MGRTPAPPPDSSVEIDLQDGYQMCARCGAVLVTDDVVIGVPRASWWLIYAHSHLCARGAVKGWDIVQRVLDARSIRGLGPHDYLDSLTPDHKFLIDLEKRAVTLSGREWPIADVLLPGSDDPAAGYAEAGDVEPVPDSWPYSWWWRALNAAAHGQLIITEDFWARLGAAAAERGRTVSFRAFAQQLLDAAKARRQARWNWKTLVDRGRDDVHLAGVLATVEHLWMRQRCRHNTHHVTRVIPASFYPIEFAGDQTGTRPEPPRLYEIPKTGYLCRLAEPLPDYPRLAGKQITVYLKYPTVEDEGDDLPRYRNEALWSGNDREIAPAFRTLVRNPGRWVSSAGRLSKELQFYLAEREAGTRLPFDHRTHPQLYRRDGRVFILRKREAREYLILNGWKVRTKSRPPSETAVSYRVSMSEGEQHPLAEITT